MRWSIYVTPSTAWLDPSNVDEVVKINIGGRNYRTLAESLLSSQFNGQSAEHQGDDQHCRREGCHSRTHGNWRGRCAEHSHKELLILDPQSRELDLSFEQVELEAMWCS
jgi:hypothetical protein